MNKLFRVVVMSSYCYEILNSLTNQSPPIGLVSNLKTWHPTGPATVKRFLPYWGAVNDLKFPKVWGAFVGFHQLFFMESYRICTLPSVGNISSIAFVKSPLFLFPPILNARVVARGIRQYNN